MLEIKFNKMEQKNYRKMDSERRSGIGSPVSSEYRTLIHNWYELNHTITSESKRKATSHSSPPLLALRYSNLRQCILHGYDETR